MEMFDLLGRRVRNQELGLLQVGIQRLTVNADRLAPGLYVARFSTGPSSCLRPFVLIR